MDYQSSGVNIDAGNAAVDAIKARVAATHTPGVLNGLGSFAGFFELPQGYDQPVLVSCTDGVGTKLRLAIEADVYDTVGIDLVAMCVNDLICCGAKPLYFLDYIATHAVEPDMMAQIVSGMCQACEDVGCAVIGGEMAEMNDMYQPGDFDLAGFSVGVVEKADIIDGSSIQAGDTLYALPSSGIHSNGFSLVRKVLPPEVMAREGISATDLLTPTRLYVNEVLEYVKTNEIRGIAHITGGGLEENIERILPKGLGLAIDFDSISVPEIFKTIQRVGNVAEPEMWRVFNMGVGMVLISPEPLDGALPIGKVVAGNA